MQGDLTHRRGLARVLLVQRLEIPAAIVPFQFRLESVASKDGTAHLERAGGRWFGEHCVRRGRAAARAGRAAAGGAGDAADGGIVESGSGLGAKIGCDTVGAGGGSNSEIVGSPASGAGAGMAAGLNGAFSRRGGEGARVLGRLGM